mmetsp:Transcript_27846/g.38881  ORF Transcript_27846/g.38881 Transcript_27846/m.38881 type:complete len:307 (+) Transcript_27846:101-1021(+)
MDTSMDHPFPLQDLCQIPPRLRFCVLTGLVVMIIVAEARKHSDTNTLLPLKAIIMKKSAADNSTRHIKKVVRAQQQRGEERDREHRLLKTAVREIRKAVKKAREFEVRHIRSRMKKEKIAFMAKNDSVLHENSSFQNSSLQNSSPLLLSLVRQQAVAKSLDLYLLTQKAVLQFHVCTSSEQFTNVSSKINIGGGGDFAEVTGKTSRDSTTTTTNDTYTAEDGLQQTISKRILKRRCIQDCADTHLKELRRFRKFRNFQRRRKQRRVRNRLNQVYHYFFYSIHNLGYARFIIICFILSSTICFGIIR